MDGSRFDRMTRRASLMTLGAMGLAGFTALANPITAGAKKKNKKKKGDINNLQLCKEQVEVWTIAITTGCNGTPTQCQAAIACASELGTCDFSGFWSCLLVAANT